MLQIFMTNIFYSFEFSNCPLTDGELLYFVGKNKNFLVSENWMITNTNCYTEQKFYLPTVYPLPFPLSILKHVHISEKSHDCVSMLLSALPAFEQRDLHRVKSAVTRNLVFSRSHPEEIPIYSPYDKQGIHQEPILIQILIGFSPF